MVVNRQLGLGVDLWDLRLLLFEILNYSTPFEFETPQETFNAIKT